MAWEDYTIARYDNSTSMRKYMAKYYDNFTYKDAVAMYNGYEQVVTVATLPVIVGMDKLKDEALVDKMYHKMRTFSRPMIYRWLVGLTALATDGTITKQYYSPKSVANRKAQLKIILGSLAAVYILAKVDII